jgi:hypothetical protein
MIFGTATPWTLRHYSLPEPSMGMSHTPYDGLRTTRHLERTPSPRPPTAICRLRAAVAQGFSHYATSSGGRIAHVQGMSGPGKRRKSDVIQPPGAELADDLIQRGGDAGDLRLADPRLQAHRIDQVIDAAGRYVLHVGLHDHWVERLVDAAAGLEDRPVGSALRSLTRLPPPPTRCVVRLAPCKDLGLSQSGTATRAL